MRVASTMTCLVLCALAATCSPSPSTPTLAVSPSGTVRVAGAQVFTATVQNTQDPVTWTLSGPGRLSTAAGLETTYAGPSTYGAQPLSATLTASVAGLSQTVTLEPGPPALGTNTIPGLSGSVKVAYDAQGIPHVFCPQMLDCLAVQGFLHARDRLFEMDLLRRTARGQLATLFGALQLDSDKQFLTFFVTRDGRRIEDAMLAVASPQSLAVLQAYASGVNAYLGQLAQSPGLLPGEYAQLPTPVTSAGEIPPWSPQDTLALARLQQFQLSESLSEETAYGQFVQTYLAGPLADPGKVNAWIRSAEPVHSYTLNPLAQREARRPPRSGLARREPKGGAPASPSTVRPLLAAVHRQVDALQKGLRGLGLGSGSNDWVVDGAHSATGHAMVANDPHLAMTYPPLFHLVGLTASDGSGLDVTGGAFPGIPGALVGRGAHVGWGVTVVGYDVTDLYLETLTVDGQGHPAVSFKGAPVTLKQVAYTIKVRGGADVPFTVSIVPHHGPVIQLDAAHHAAVSFRWTGHEATDDLRGFLGLNLASAVGEVGDDPSTSTTAFAALTFYTTGAQNFVLADDQGNIGYDPHARVPRRPWAGSAPAGTPLLPWLPLPGDGTAEWGSQDAGDTCDTTPQPGCWVADVDLPHGRNPDAGFFLTANSDPLGDTADNNPIINPRSAAPSYLSFDWDDVTGFRAARIGELLKQKLADGGTMTVDDMAQVQSDHSVGIAAALLPSLVAVPAPSQSDAFRAGLAVLQAWSAHHFDCPTGLAGLTPDSPPDGDSIRVANANACLLFHTFLRTLLLAVFQDDLRVAGLGVDAGAALRALFHMLEPATPPSDTTFCNDVDGQGRVTATHTCPEQLALALASAVEGLTLAYGDSTHWLWGRVHTLTPQSLAAPLIGAPFEAGPYARPGGAETVDVGSPGLTPADPRTFAYGAGSQVRHISVMDPSSPLTLMQLPGGENDLPSGVVAGADRLLIQYIQNEYFTFAHGGQLDATNGVVGTETFSP